MMVNHSVAGASPSFVEEGEAVMEEGLTEKNEGIEDITESCTENGGQVETFGYLIEEERRQSSSSSDFLTSETTTHEEQSHSSSETSSPPFLGWPIQKGEVPDCTRINGTEDEVKPHMGGRIFEKQGSEISGFFLSR